jgi:hypothetical protein
LSPCDTILQSGSVYNMYANLLWSGIVRVALWAASSKLQPLSSRTFGGDVVRAQMNQRRFFTSLAAEMLTMVDWCVWMLVSSVDQLFEFLAH